MDHLIAAAGGFLLAGGPSPPGSGGRKQLGTADSREGRALALLEPPRRRIGRVFLHCSASDDEALAGDRLVAEVRAWHLARGFSDVGYHFLVDKRGSVMPGRGLEKAPAAQKGHNAGTIAIMVHGLEEFPKPALDACRDLCRSINEACEGRITYHGHCEVSAKPCPVFDYSALLGLDRFGRMPAGD